MESIREGRDGGEVSSRVTTPLCCIVNTFVSCSLCPGKWCAEHWTKESRVITGHYWYRCDITNERVAATGNKQPWKLIQAK